MLAVMAYSKSCSAAVAFVRTLSLIAALAAISCGSICSLWAAEQALPCVETTAIGVPARMRHAVIYEINARLYSGSGKFTAVTADSKRLRALGAAVLWLMPLHPIEEHNRKGSLPSRCGMIVASASRFQCLVWFRDGTDL